MDKGKLTVLIVEDQEINRLLLQGILKKEYNVVEAENGKDAFEKLRQYKDIAAILVDIIMPVMDGYTFLRKLKKTEFSSLPVIAVTGEKDENTEQKVLNLGAWDFVIKPYIPRILMMRLKNVIVRSQYYMISEVNYVHEHDPLTGLYNRNKFFEETRLLIESNKDNVYALVRFDIDKFHLLNSFWGESEGDRFLKFIAGYMQRICNEVQPCTIGRISADVFCLCVPFDEAGITEYVDNACNVLEAYNKNYLIEPSFGVYVIRDHSLDIQTMYEYATLASKECKGKYMVTLYYYKPELSEKIEREQEIVNEMQTALDENQFVVYYQPKYNLRNELPYGAEALIRWKHPTKGMIMPGAFIPVFEKNGFIGKVDYYMWDKVCQWLRKRMDEGHESVPVSVNVSRVNMYNPNLVDILTALVKKYDIPPELLNLEITESAYMDSPGVMEKTVTELQEKGFLILMDDFGSGYSSLNTLKNIPVDVLKIDINFMSGVENQRRSECILASIIHMAGWLELPVVMEGVETAEQVDFLKSIGCGYVQGFYYARPMPQNEYEDLINGVRQTPVESISENHREMSRALWSTDGTINLLFNSIVDPVAIYKYEGNDFKALRVNEKFNECFGYGGALNEGMYGKIGSDISEEDTKIVADAIREVADSRGEKYCYYKRTAQDGKLHKIKMYMKYWGKNEASSIIFCMFYDV